MKGLAAVLVSLNQPLILDEIQFPKPSFGQVLVKLTCTGICGTQLGEISGVKGEDKFLPHLLGHEGSGSVLECGPGVKKVKEGDQVVLHWRKGEGIQSETPVYHSSKLGKINAGWVTTFNEYAVVSENRVTGIPNDFDPEIAALMGCAVTTGLGVVVNDAKLTLGESIVVIGSGGVGLSVIQGAALTSAYPITAVDIHDNKLELAKRFGATHLINSEKQNLREELKKIFGFQPPDVIIESTGNPKMIELAYELVSPVGRVILVGVPKKGNNINIFSLPLHFGKILKGSHGGEANPSIDIPKYVRLFNSGRLELKNLITNRFEFSQIQKAIEKMQTGEISGRCILRMN